MIPNLYHLSSTKQKLSSEELGHGPGMIPRHKILMALMVDLFIVAAVSSLLTSLIGLSLGSYFSTPTLQKVWSLMRFNFLSLATISSTPISCSDCSISG